MKKSLLALSLLCTFLMTGCNNSSNDNNQKSNTTPTPTTSVVTPTSTTSEVTPTPSTETQFSIKIEHTQKFTFAFANSLYQGAGDTFPKTLPDALASGSFVVSDDADGSEVASFAGAWMTLSLLNNGLYTLTDNVGYGMSETGTWTLGAFTLSLTSSVEGASTTVVKFGEHYSLAFVNSIYQGASDTFDFGTLPEALSSGTYTVGDDADGSEVASFAGAWMKLSLLNNGTYTLTDNVGYGMSETGTWSLASFAFTFKSSVDGATEVKFAVKDVLSVAFANPLYQGAGDSFVVELPDALASGSFVVGDDADGSEVASFAGAWMKLSLLNNGTYTLTDNVGYGMSETGTWTLNAFNLVLVSGYAA